MVDAPLSDADVPAFWQALGLPGLIDLHVHFMPGNVLAKVWAYFDRIRKPDGTVAWPLVQAYRGSDDDRLELLRAMGVRRFGSALYPHKPGMAEWLNSWAQGFAAGVPDVVQTFTFYPEPEADRYVAEALEAGGRLGKVHLQVGAYNPCDPLLRPVWARLSAARIPVIVHCGSGPEPGPFTGPAPFGEVLAAQPDLVALVAHMGMPEYEAFWQLTLRYPNVHLDTTMAFTDFTEATMPYPPELLDVLAAHPERVVFGTDFPNTPHTYAHQIQALVRLGLGDDWLRAVCWHNPLRLLSLGGRPEGP